jgi:ankyrin repeat protein
LQYDEVDVVKSLLELGADPNHAFHGTNTTPLMMVRSGAAAKALIEAGAIVSLRNQNELSALYRAAYLAPDVTEVLLKAGVAVDEPVDSSHVTALWHAACRGNVGVVSLLLAAGANPSVSSNGLSALECAQRGKEDARSRRPSPFDGKPPFVEDFDGVIARLQSALISRKPK